MSESVTFSPPSLDRLVSPSISVVICNFNYGKYLGEAIDSVLTQMYSAREVIVVDDGSTDTSRDVLKRYQDDARVVPVLKSNGGQYSAYNAGFSLVRGSVVIFLDSDDILQPNALSEVAALFDLGVSKVHYKLELIDGAGVSQGVTIPGYLSAGSVSEAYLKKGVPHCSPPASGNAFRKSVLDVIFPLPCEDGDKYGADFMCIYGAALFGKVGRSELVLGKYRVHAKPEVSDPLIFGNSESNSELGARQRERARKFSGWILIRTEGRIAPPVDILDFSMEKIAYSVHVERRATLWTRVVEARKKLPRLLRSLWLRDGFHMHKKAALTVWAILLPVLPRPLRSRAAAYVCNPTARG